MDQSLTLSNDQKPRVLVVGDLMVDRTRRLKSDRIDSATATFIAADEGRDDQLGGAAYVARLLSGFGAEVVVAGVVGRDGEGADLVSSLEQDGVETIVQEDAARPTTLKERFFLGDQSSCRLIGRIDRESTSPLDAFVERALIKAIADEVSQCDAVILSDYAKGVCTIGLAASVIAKATRAGVPVIVDPACRASLDRFVGCTIITPSRKEAANATGVDVSSLDKAKGAGQALRRQLNSDGCVVTLDRDGIVIVSAADTHADLPATKAAVVDTTGAGDAFVAWLTYAIAVGANLSDAATEANTVAGLQVQRFGTAPILREDIDAALRQNVTLTGGTLQDLADVVEARRASGERIVLTNGCFDLLHAGHVAYLEEARREGDCLVVAVNTDSTVRQLKGIHRPIMREHDRAALLGALACVDHVVLFAEPTPHEVIRRLKPDVLVKGGDYASGEVIGRELVESYGGTVKTLCLTPGQSTTAIVERLGMSSLRVSEAG